MSYKTYENYKDSDIEWIGKIPSSWDLVRNKNLFIKSKVIVGQRWKEYPVLSLTKQGVILKNIELNEGKMPSDFSIYQIISPGNLLLCLFDIDVTPRCVGFIENKGIVSAAYSEIKAITNISMKYYYYWYLNLDIGKTLLHLSKNLRNSLSNEDFMALPIVKPSLEEQIKIASYLDKKTSEIDKNIDKNKELISLLEEKKISLINKSVVNEDYPINKLNNILVVGGYIRGPFGSALKRDELKYEGIPVYEQQHAIYGSRDFRYFIDSEKYKELQRFTIKPNDLIISCSGTVGKISIIEEDDPIGIISQALLIFRVNSKKILPKFLKYFLTSHKGNTFLVSTSMGSAQKNISRKEVIDKIPINIPPLNIQESIVFELDSQIEKINTIIKKVENNISLLEEYKSSLIYNVVTGKIDVRDEV